MASKGRIPVREALSGYLFVLPFLLVFLVFLGYPVMYSGYLSLHKTTLYTDWYDVFGDMKWCGLDNYVRLLTQDRAFWHSILATGLYALLTIPAGIALSLGLALILHNKLKGAAFFRAAFFLPNVLDMLVVGIIWVLLYSPHYGLIDRVLQSLGLDVLPSEGVLGHPATVLPAIGFAMVLKGAGFGMILFLTALQNIPDSIYEAADIDGATPVQSFWYVTVPQLRPIFFFMTVTGLMAALNAFTEIYAMTGGNGGPTRFFMGAPVRAAELSGFYLFTRFQQGSYGYAAAISFILLLGALLFTATQRHLLRED